MSRRGNLFFGLHSAYSDSARRDSRANQYATGILVLTPSSGSAPARNGLCSIQKAPGFGLGLFSYRCVIPRFPREILLCNLSRGPPEYGVSRLAGVSFWLAFRTRTGRRCRKIRITQTSGNYMKPVDSFCLFLQWSWRFVTISIYSFILQPTCRKRYFQPISAKMFS